MDEISQLQDYLAAGGKLLLTSSVYAQTPQLDAVLAQFGLARAEGMVVEGDSSKALYNLSLIHISILKVVMGTYIKYGPKTSEPELR